LQSASAQLCALHQREAEVVVRGQLRAFAAEVAALAERVDALSGRIDTLAGTGPRDRRR
jgi:ubiquinone biosynthesis protein UbiJ